MDITPNYNKMKEIDEEKIRFYKIMIKHGSLPVVDILELRQMLERAKHQNNGAIITDISLILREFGEEI